MIRKIISYSFSLLIVSAAYSQTDPCAHIAKTLIDYENEIINLTFEDLLSLESLLNPEMRMSSSCADQLFHVSITMFDYAFNNNMIERQIDALQKIESYYPLLSYNSSRDSINNHYLLEYARGDLASTFNQQEIAEKHYLNTLQIISPYKMDINQEDWRNYNFALQNLANTNLSMGKYQSALDYAQQSLDHVTEIYKNLSGQPHNSMRLTSIADAYKGLGDKENYNKIIAQVATFFKNKIDIKGPEYARDGMFYISAPFREHADACINNKKLDEALVYILMLEKYEDKNNLQSKVYNALLKARHQFASGKSKMAHSTIQQALINIKQQKTEMSWTHEVTTRLQQAKFYKWDHQYDKALIQLSIVDDVLSTNQEKANVIYGYREYAKLYSAECYRGINDNEQAFQIIQTLISDIRNKMTSSYRLADHLIKIDLYYPWVEVALDTWWQLEDQDANDAFQLFETIKSLDLFKQLALSIDSKSATPELLSALELNQESIYDLKKKVAQGDTSFTVKNKLIELKLQKDQLKENIQSNNSRKIAQQKISLSEYQSYIDKNTAHLLYFSGDDHYYSLLITANDAHTNRIVKQDLDPILEEFLVQISDPSQFSIKNNIASIRLAEALSLESYLSEEINRLIISPDGIMHRIPFEAIMKPDGQFWIEKRAISYTPSANMQYYIEHELKPILVRDAALYLPSYSKTNTRLAFSEKEANQIMSILSNHKLYKQQNASKESFLNRYKQHQLIHLMTHAHSDYGSDKEPYIIMGNNADATANQMTMEEIKRLSLDTELIGLSACETATGEVHNGEGVFSLATALLGAGSRSALGTMWATNDQTTQMIMTEFYKSARKMPKDQALQTAKLSYLSEYKGTEYQHPFYWAGVTLVGSRNMLEFSNNSTSIIILVGFIITLSMIFIFWYFKNNK